MSMQDVEVLRAACCIPGADGEVRDVEADYLCRLASKLGVGQASLDAMTDVARSDQEFFEQQFQILKEQPLDSMKVLIRLALADGAISREEGKMAVQSRPGARPSPE